MDGGNIYSQGGKIIFPRWEDYIPKVGRVYSQRGNILFPVREEMIGMLLKNRGMLLRNKFRLMKKSIFQ